MTATSLVKEKGLLDYPLPAIVGHEDLKIALLINLVNPKIGGLLVTGDKGTGKTIGVKSIRRLLHEIEIVADCKFNCNPYDPSEMCKSCQDRLLKNEKFSIKKTRILFIELPLSITEEMMTGSSNLEKLINQGIIAFQPGLLSKSHRNILFVDNINLLDNQIVDTLLDSAAMGYFTIERDQLSITHLPSRFILIGTMNDEEGNLRPQILDRFPIHVNLKTMADPEEHIEIIRRRLEYEKNPAAFVERYKDEEKRLIDKIIQAKSLLENVETPEYLFQVVGDLCSLLKVDGLRPDIQIIKVSKTLAALDGRTKVEDEDVRRSSKFVLTHRTRLGGMLEPPSEQEIINLLNKLLLSTRTKFKPRTKEEQIGKDDLFLGTSTRPSKVKAIVRDANLFEGIETFTIGEVVLPIKKIMKALLLIQIFAVIGLLTFLSSVSAIPNLALISMTLLIVLGYLVFQAGLFILFRGKKHMTIGVIVSGALIGAFAYIAYSLFITMGIMGLAIEAIALLFLGIAAYVYNYFFLPKKVSRQPGISIRFDEEEVADVGYSYSNGITEIESGDKVIEEIEPVSEAIKFDFGRDKDKWLIRRMQQAKRKFSKTKSLRGRVVGYEIPKEQPITDVAFSPTIHAAAPHQTERRDEKPDSNLAVIIKTEDIRIKSRRYKAPLTIMLALDASISMRRYLEGIRKAIFAIHRDVYRFRDKIGLVVLKGSSSEVMAHPTTNLRLISGKLKKIGLGDQTPLAAGMQKAINILKDERRRNKETIPVMLLITDGNANIPLRHSLRTRTSFKFVERAKSDCLDLAQEAKRQEIRIVVINPGHSEADLKRGIDGFTYTPSSLCKGIANITNGKYFGFDASKYRGKEIELDMKIAESIREGITSVGQ